MALVICASGLNGTRPAHAVDQRPNVLLIVADDQPTNLFTRTFMPSVFSQLVDRGVNFGRAYVNSSVCCPSRSQILTGLFEHHTGVDENDQSLDRPTLPMALHDQGYRTAMVGKYLNSWDTCGPRPEYDRWACVASGKSDYSLVDPWINDGGVWKQVSGYQPDLLADRLIDFVGSTPADQPFFAMYSPTSPHLPANGGKYPGMAVPGLRTPAYDHETRTLDTPMYLRGMPLTAADTKAFDSQRKQMGRASRALDDSIARILSSLGSRADSTLVIYVSDNGYHYGEHRRSWKASPYEESIRVPMVLRYPGVLPSAAAYATDALVQNVDIAPTIAQLAGIPWGADGRSLVPLLDRSATAVRDAALIERCRGKKFLTDPCRGLGWYPTRQTTYPAYEGVITATHAFVRYPVTGELQLFDLVADPWEMTNLAAAPGSATLVADLQARLDALMGPPPIETTIVTGPRGSIRQRTAVFTYFSQARTATYRCRLTFEGTPGPWHACNGQSVVEGGLLDGSYLFEVAGTDEAGAVDPTPASRAFQVASSGPAVRLTSTPPAAQTARSAAFGFSSPVDGVTFQCRLSGWGSTPAPWVACDPAVGASYTGLADGAWQFEVRATDPATSAVTEPPASWLVRIDNTGPGWVFGARPAAVTDSTAARFVFAPTEGVTGPVTCALDGAAPIECTAGTFGAGALKGGWHALTIRASDELGNPSSTKVSWQIDLSAPTVSITSAPPATTTSTTPAFTLASVGGGSMFRCELDGWPPIPCTSKPAIGTLPLGGHTLTVRAVDKVGNVSPPVSYSWTIVA